MTIYNSREEAYKKALEIKARHKGASMDEGEVTFCGEKDGQFKETKVGTIEVSYERYDCEEGWLDCSACVLYRK